MRFGIFSNGFRPHTTAAASYAEDIHEIVLAEELGFEDAYISEHHGEPPYVRRVDTIPMPDMLICKAAGLTKRIRMGSAVKLIHLHHPLDVAIQAAITDHLLGPDRYIFGFGTGFRSPLFCEERGLSFEDRHERLAESLEAILKCWKSESAFDLDGKYWQGKNLIALPQPLSREITMATATDTDSMVRLSAERGYTMLTTFQDTAAAVRARADQYCAFAAASGRPNPRANMTVSRLVYIADSREQAIEDLRSFVTIEVGVQAERGFLKYLKAKYNLEVPNDSRAVDVLVESGIYMVGTADEVTAKLERFWQESGGFGTLLIAAGKDWATREKRDASMRAFMRDVAPRLRHLEPR